MATHWVINNTCSYDINIWNVVSEGAPSPILVTRDSFYYEPLSAKNDLGGPSIRMAPASYSDDTIVTQLEYTLSPGNLFYDISNINGYPFVEHGVSLKSSIKGCFEVVCPAGKELCHDAYNTPYDNWATRACDPEGYLTFKVC
ncbi:hypothetical protein FQN57_001210 [Myotisia sp. PD_48]|nr:hypothetical protein FQN57_001210 [Myotisia sp. PD_48]